MVGFGCRGESKSGQLWRAKADFCRDRKPARVTARDTFGQAVACPLPGKGLVRLPVPSSGYLEIAY